MSLCASLLALLCLSLPLLLLLLPHAHWAGLQPILIAVSAAQCSELNGKVVGHTVLASSTLVARDKLVSPTQLTVLRCLVPLTKRTRQGDTSTGCIVIQFYQILMCSYLLGNWGPAYYPYRECGQQFPELSTLVQPLQLLCSLYGKDYSTHRLCS